jgi:hypothetical protein
MSLYKRIVPAAGVAAAWLACGALPASAAIFFITPGTQIAPKVADGNLLFVEGSDEKASSLTVDGGAIKVTNNADGSFTIPVALVSGTLRISDGPNTDSPGTLSEIITFKSGLFSTKITFESIGPFNDGSPAELEVGNVQSRVPQPFFPFFGTATTSITISSPKEAGCVVACDGTGIPELDTVVAVPEPATWAMFIVGFAGLGAVMRGSRRTVSGLEAGSELAV